MKISPTSACIGAIITDIDLRSATPEEIAGIRSAIDEHCVLAFPDQGAMTDAEQVAFTLQFGAPYIHPIARMGGVTELRAGHIVDDRDHPPYQDKWHTDVSWDPHPPTYGTLRMVELPERGGDTVFASQYATYDALSEPMRTMLDGLSAVLPPPVTREAVEHFCRHEWAREVDDIMLRRTSWQHYVDDPEQTRRQVQQWMQEGKAGRAE